MAMSSYRSPKRLKVSVRLNVLRVSETFLALDLSLNGLNADCPQVSCPGVCVSGRSELVLRVWLLGEALRTAPAPPVFPLRFDRTFHLSQVRYSQISQVQKLRVINYS